jgi:transposase-like protein
LPDTQAQTQSPRAAARPRCPKCQSQTEVRYIAAARTGFQRWTLRCTRCGLIHEAQVGADPMKSDAAGRQHGGLPAPQ